MNILTIAGNTFKESVRDRIFYVLLLFAVAFLLISKAIGWVGLDEAKISKDFGLTTIWFFAIIIAIYVGTGLIYKEIDKRTIYTVLSKPVEKYEFVFGKYLGLALMLLVNVVVMGMIFLSYYWLTISRPSGALVIAMFLIYLEVVFVTAFAMMFGSVASPILSAVFTFAMFLAGHFADAFMLLAERGKHLGQPLMRGFFLLMYYVMPNLTFFDRKSEAVHQLPIYPQDVLLAVVYCVVYSAILLIVSLFAFKRRNF